MDQTVTTCALLGRFEDSGVAETAAALLPALAKRGLVTLVQNSADWQRFAGQVQVVDDAQLLERAQLGIVIGGDGSLLYAARLVAQAGIPLLGINRGRLGFLTDVMPQDMLDSLDAALQGRCSVDKRPLLDARIVSPNRPPPRQLAGVKRPREEAASVGAVPAPRLDGRTVLGKLANKGVKFGSMAAAFAKPPPKQQGE